jgi:pSer/pThr/pTyr-binding forkhead associated (FHA) protein
MVLASRKVSRRHARLFEECGIWFVEDLGSANGTRLNEQLVPPRIAVRLQHGDRLQVGRQVFRFSRPAELDDEERTEAEEVVETPAAAADRLSPLQEQVVKILCEEWLASGSLERLPTNEEIARRLGTPEAAATVKAALRRVYAKAGLSDMPSQAKRRALCRVANDRGWI